MTLERKIESCETSIRFCMEDLKKQTGFEEPAERKTITDTEFEKRLNLRKHDFKVFGYYRIVLGVIVLLYFGIKTLLA